VQGVRSRTRKEAKTENPGSTEHPPWRSRCGHRPGNEPVQGAAVPQNHQGPLKESMFNPSLNPGSKVMSSDTHSQPGLKGRVLEAWFLNFSMRKNHQGSLFKHSLLGPT
jgi:hypothetical protein